MFVVCVCVCVCVRVCAALITALSLDLAKPSEGQKVHLSLIVGIANTMLWSVLSLMPIVQVSGSALVGVVILPL